MAQKYEPVWQYDKDDSSSPSDPEDKPRIWEEQNRPSSKPRTPRWAYAVIILLLLTNTLQTGLFTWYRSHSTSTDVSMTDSPRHAEAALPKIPEVYRQFWWNTAYSSTNETEQDEMWNQILWTHGMIQADKTWAQAQNWPDTMTHPRDQNKGVWLLEGYHEVHCLGVLRRYMNDTFAGEPPSAEDPVVRAHVAHCFDYLLQVSGRDRSCRRSSPSFTSFGKVGC